MKGGVMNMFKNLEAEMTRKNISFEKMSELLGISYNSFRFKMKGITEWKLSEILKIQEILSTDTKLSLEYLFTKSE